MVILQELRQILLEHINIKFGLSKTIPLKCYLFGKKFNTNTLYLDTQTYCSKCIPPVANTSYIKLRGQRASTAAEYCRKCKHILEYHLSFGGIYTETKHICSLDILQDEDLYRLYKLLEHNSLNVSCLKQLMQKFVPDFPIDMII